MRPRCVDEGSGHVGGVLEVEYPAELHCERFTTNGAFDGHAGQRRHALVAPGPEHRVRAQPHTAHAVFGPVDLGEVFGGHLVHPVEGGGQPWRTDGQHPFGVVGDGAEHGDAAGLRNGRGAVLPGSLEHVHRAGDVHCRTE